MNSSSLSLEAVNDVLAEHDAERIPMDRFRPNIVVGPDDNEQMLPFEEDRWRELRAGNVTMFAAWACARCIIPETNQATGERGKSVLRALSAFRRGIDAHDASNKGVFFGQNILHVAQNDATLTVGDTVEVRARSSYSNIVGLD